MWTCLKTKQTKLNNNNSRINQKCSICHRLAMAIVEYWFMKQMRSWELSSRFPDRLYRCLVKSLWLNISAQKLSLGIRRESLPSNTSSTFRILYSSTELTTQIRCLYPHIQEYWESVKSSSACLSRLKQRINCLSQ